MTASHHQIVLILHLYTCQRCIQMMQMMYTDIPSEMYTLKQDFERAAAKTALDTFESDVFLCQQQTTREKSPFNFSRVTFKRVSQTACGKVRDHSNTTAHVVGRFDTMAGRLCRAKVGF